LIVGILLYRVLLVHESMTEEQWVDLGMCYGVRPNQWKIYFGLDLSSTVKLGNMFGKWIVAMPDLKPYHLLWFLYYCWVHPRNWTLAGAWAHVSRETFEKYFNITLSVLYSQLDLIQWEWRKWGQDENPIEAYSTVDTICCEIPKPGVDYQKYWCAKCRCHVLKYEIGVSTATFLIVSLGGGVGGSTHDLTIARQGIIHNLDPLEKIWGDRAYRDKRFFLTPIGNKDNRKRLTKEAREWNNAHSILRFQTGERVNKRLRSWGILGIGKWRGNYAVMYMIVKVICNIFNFEMLYC